VQAADPEYDDGLRLAPERSYEVKTFDVCYRQANGEAWLARVYQPQGTGPFPALLDVHGGAWSEGDRLLNAPIDEALAASGLVVAAIDFRLGPAHAYPASIQDTNYATRWLKAHANEFNADPRQLGGLGASSGGHMVLLSAMRPRDPRYVALPLPEAPAVEASLAYIVAVWPILDPHARYFFAQATGREDLVRATEGYFLSQDAMQEGSPQCLLDRGEAVELPPTLILQGTADTNLSLDMTERFATTYRTRGGHCELELFPGMPHRFAHAPGPETDRAIRLTKAFIARQLAGARGVR
jgi:acetyl esterase/lipase